MSSFQPPLYNSDVFNSSLFNYDDETPLTVYDGDRRYLKISGGVVNGFSTFTNGLAVNNGLTLDGNLVNLNVISGITPGTVSASKALVVDANKDISTINTLTANSIYGTLQTAAQPNITSLGTLTSLNLSRNSTNFQIVCTTGYSYLGTSNDNDICITRNNVIVAKWSPLGLRINESDNAAYPLDVKGDISSDGNWRNKSTILMNNTGQLQYAAQPNITSVGTLGSLAVTNGITASSLSATTITGTLQTAAQPNITSVGNLTSLNINQASSTSNRLRLSYTADSVYDEMYCDSTGYLYLSKKPITESYNKSVATCDWTIEAMGRRAPITGFEDLQYSTISYDASTRIFSIAPAVFNYNIWTTGFRITKTTTEITSDHPTTAGATYWFYFNEMGMLTYGTSAPNMRNNVMIAVVYYYDSTHTILLEERHGIIMDPDTHQELHNTIGTYYVSGLALSGYTLDGTTNANNTFASSAGVISDEDLRSSISAVADGGPYTVFYLTGASSLWTWTTGNSVPYSAGTYIKYNQWTGTAWQLTDLSTIQWVNYYVVYAPSLSTATQMLLIPGQTAYTSLATAQAESFSSLNTGSLLLPEYLVLYQITYKANASLTTTGKCQIAAVQRYTSSRSVASATTAVNHQALSGLQLAASGNTYGHIDDQAQTIKGSKTFSDKLLMAGETPISCSGDFSLMCDRALTIQGNQDHNSYGLTLNYNYATNASYIYAWNGLTTPSEQATMWLNAGVFISRDAKVGIGNTAPTEILDVTGCVKATSYKQGSTTYDISLLSPTPGTATASKAIVLDSNKDIATINSLTTTSLTTGSGYVLLNGTRYTDARGGPLLNSRGPIAIIGNNSMWNDGSANYDTVLACLSSNATNPVKFVFQIDNRTNATSTSGAYIGTESNNDLILMTNNSRKMTLSAAGNLGIANTAPAYKLDITGDMNLTGVYKMDSTTIIDSSSKFIGVGVDTAARVQMKIDGFGLSHKGTLGGSHASREIVSYVGSDACMFGTYSNDNFQFITNNIPRAGFSGGTSDMWIGYDSLSAYSRLYVQANDTLQYALHLKGGFNYTGLGVDAITQMIYSASGAARTTSWSGTNKVCLLCEGGGIMVEDYAVASYSDRRRKTNIQYYDDLDCDRIIDGINKISIASFNYKRDGNKAIGLIAQDLALNELVEVLTLNPDDSMKIEDEGDIEGFAYSIDYSKIGLYLIPYIKRLNARIELLESEVKFLQNK